MSNRLVYLGLPKKIEPNRRFHLKSIYLPIGKIGGKPSWLNPTTVPKATEVQCEICEKPMALVVQVYATDPADHEHAFHRYLYVFVCRNPECSKLNNSSNLKVLRCQLPRENDFYSGESRLVPGEEEVEDPFFNEKAFNKTCSTCGLKAASRCSKCDKAWYCGRDHQILDWTRGHKAECAEGEVTNPSENTFLFPEYALQMTTYEEFAFDPDDYSDDEDEEMDENLEFESKQLEKLKIVQEEMKEKGIGADGKELDEMDEKKDKLYKYFTDLVQDNPEQVFRYARGAEPLLSSDYSPKPSEIPPCELCQAPREFEFQLMPHLISLMEVDAIGQSIDWSTVLIYTCSKRCSIPKFGYAKEFVFKQDFVDPKDEVETVEE
ncbi:unnamed protein product [Bursaphelenchus xylophilus]|uniref:(pine wood nematode) hypothetical protein n=1 Tax=Bursaphelenchus xylophilus TaxID=6326 RepID=A0A1I7S832_BURXY|nr:unnamed protein product [Bursaphelenchus xylophilus]CAG9080640.1 unnamed protein product [Bursaphelenchus xylophilus]